MTATTFAPGPAWDAVRAADGTPGVVNPAGLARWFEEQGVEPD